MKPSLPELTRQCFLFAKRKQKLILRAASFLSTQLARHSLLQDLHDRRRCAPRGLTNKKMNVIRHHNISDQKKGVAISNFAQYFCEHTFRPSRAKQRHPAIASARHKMQIVFAIISFEIFRHECKYAEPHPLRAAKDGPPRFVILLQGEYSQWYHRREISEREKHGERLRHPPESGFVAFSIHFKNYPASGHVCLFSNGAFRDYAHDDYTDGQGPGWVVKGTNYWRMK
jgi:hypothetical protein